VPCEVDVNVVVHEAVAFWLSVTVPIVGGLPGTTVKELTTVPTGIPVPVIVEKPLVIPEVDCGTVMPVSTFDPAVDVAENVNGTAFGAAGRYVCDGSKVIVGGNGAVLPGFGAC